MGGILEVAADNGKNLTSGIL